MSSRVSIRCPTCQHTTEVDLDVHTPPFKMKCMSCKQAISVSEPAIKAIQQRDIDGSRRDTDDGNGTPRNP